MIGLRYYKSQEEFIINSYYLYDEMTGIAQGMRHYPDIDDGELTSYYGRISFYCRDTEEWDYKIYKLTLKMHYGGYEFTPLFESIELIENNNEETYLLQPMFIYNNDNYFYVKYKDSYYELPIEQYDVFSKLKGRNLTKYLDDISKNNKYRCV